MSFEKINELADEFLIQAVEHYYENQAPIAIKANDIAYLSLSEQLFISKIAGQDVAALSLKERSQMKGHGPSNLLADDNALVDEKIWNRAKKVVKKYWNKYDEPWAVVYDVYRKMGGKSKKKPKKK